MERRDEGRGEGKLVVLVFVGMGRNLGRLITDGRREGGRNGRDGWTRGMEDRGVDGWEHGKALAPRRSPKWSGS